jgi:ATP-dependent RNA helicase DDX51/DBP6
LSHRLFLLVKLFGGIEVAEYSSNLNTQQRHGILRDFRQGSIQLLICSDAMARGMDIDNVSYVISYDAPKFVKTYIHRVGRTARAGNEGKSSERNHVLIDGKI